MRVPVELPPPAIKEAEKWEFLLSQREPFLVQLRLLGSTHIPGPM